MLFGACKLGNILFSIFNYSRLEKLYFLYLIYRAPGHRVSQCPI
jgi:hypothetical protein